MMNVKKYRATTTREALEQVKADLGEDAFVLETKQIRKGGFLGFKSEAQIEISAAVPTFNNKLVAKKTNQTFNATNTSSNQILKLKDDSPAVPNSADFEEIDERRSILTALNSRAAMLENFDNSMLAKNSGAAFSKENKAIDKVEISHAAPRIVHQKKEVVKQTLVPEISFAAEPSESKISTAPTYDIDWVRAELREIKFALGAFSHRQNVLMFEKEPDLKTFGEVLDEPFYNAYLKLTAAGIPSETARALIAKCIPQCKANLITADELPHYALIQELESKCKFDSDPFKNSAVMAVIGATGVGKTTTIAKLAARLALHEHRRVELVTIDTYRIAAVEQMKTYAEIIGAGCHVVHSVFELDAVLQKMSADAHVLIDTTGKNPYDLSDQHELAKYLHRHSEIRKCLAIQATINPFDGVAITKKFAMYGADCLALTKLDETIRAGAMLKLVTESSLPLAYLCSGQRVPEDLQTATPDSFAESVLR